MPLEILMNQDKVLEWDGTAVASLTFHYGVFVLWTTRCKHSGLFCCKDCPVYDRIGTHHKVLLWGGTAVESLTFDNGVFVLWTTPCKHSEAGPYCCKGCPVNDSIGTHHKVPELVTLQHQCGI